MHSHPALRGIVPIVYAFFGADGALPLVVTINGAQVDEQLDLARHAEQTGASWLILQPPPKAQAEAAVRAGEAVDSESYCAAFFEAVLRQTPLAAGIRNAPEYLGLGEVHDRAPALQPTDFGLQAARRFALQLGAWDAQRPDGMSSR